MTSAAISEHDRKRMREEAERVIGDHPNVFNDAHMMAIFVCQLLDGMEGPGALTDREPGAAITDPGDDDNESGRR